MPRSVSFIARPLPIIIAAALILWVGAPAARVAYAKGSLNKVNDLSAATASAQFFIASIDTMKQSRDTETRPLSATQIAADVNLAASLNTTYITVDTHFEYPAYMGQWVAAIRSTGHHVWFRIHPNQWGNNNGTTGIMTPSQYEAAERSFLSQHASFFGAGDILDPCPEPENGKYWIATYGPYWSWKNTPNTATREFNAFVRDTSDIASQTLAQFGVYGVDTSVRSTNANIARDTLELQTVAKFGHITIDSYIDSDTTDPAAATSLRINELNMLENTWHVPIILGEIGYSNTRPVDDATQHAVLSTELNAMAALPFLVGVNYWVGAGTNNSGGFTHVFIGNNAGWMPRPAAYDLAAYYARIQTAGKPLADTIGVYHPATNTFYLRNSNTGGAPDITVKVGDQNSYPLVGDWNGDGLDTVGVYNQRQGVFTLYDSNMQGAPIAHQFVLGNPGDQPFAGHWLASASHDGVGVYRPSNGLIYLAANFPPMGGIIRADYTIVLGNPGDIGFGGRWQPASALDTPGVYRPSSGRFYMTYGVCNQRSCIERGDADAAFGALGDLPITGDWSAIGHDGIGVFQPSTGTFSLKSDVNSGSPDFSFVFGSPGDIPVAGHWAIVNPTQSATPTHPLSSAPRSTPIPPPTATPVNRFD